MVREYVKLRYCFDVSYPLRGVSESKVKSTASLMSGEVDSLIEVK